MCSLVTGKVGSDTAIFYDLQQQEVSVLVVLYSSPVRCSDIYRSVDCAADRYYWNAWDPVHVCEGLFAVGNILNFTRLFHLLAINEHLGPMLISLERMIKVRQMQNICLFFCKFLPKLHELNSIKKLKRPLCVHCFL